MNLDITYLDYQIELVFEWGKGVKYKVVPKGRRVGITRGLSHGAIELLMTGQGPILWGETTHGNIERYFERYFYPVLEQNKIPFRFDRQAKKLTINKQYCDFRSADNPENWEGFGYKYIFLNEAGIILKDRSLYINSVLPMLLDYSDSKLIAAGGPKGKFLRDGSEHPFYTLHKRALENNSQYWTHTFTSYDNPLLSSEDIKELEQEIEIFSPEQVRQEIYGEFIETDALNPFITDYDPACESEQATFRPDRQLIISVDFNLNPFCVTFHNNWQDQQGLHHYQVDEGEIKQGSIPAMADFIKNKDGGIYITSLFSCILTGDAMGNRGDISQRDNATLYLQLIRELGINESQVKVGGNPKHQNSRSDCNYFLKHFPDYKINPKTCPNSVRDFKTVQCDAFGQIQKKNRNDLAQRADFLDGFRYVISNIYKPWIDRHQKERK